MQIAEQVVLLAEVSDHAPAATLSVHPVVRKKALSVMLVSAQYEWLPMFVVPLLLRV